MVDEIFRIAAEPGMTHLHDKPYDSVAARLVEVRYRAAVYTIAIELDGSKAVIDSFWGHAQLSVNGAEANEEQLQALLERWKVGEK
ncbi:hypothetical protein ACWDWS_02455 [Streptomyces sp. NPDC003328]